LTDRLLTTFKQKITGLRLIPAGGGCFEVTIDGELVYSKLATGEFPDDLAILDKVQARVKKR
jgi:selenoprotein W-related protein